MTRRLRVAVDAMSYGLGGGGTVLAGQLSALAVRDDVEVTAFTTPAHVASVAETGSHAVGVRVPGHLGAAARVAVEQLTFPRRSRRFDVLYMPAGFGLLHANVPQVVLLQNPYHFGAAGRHIRKTMLPRRLAARVRAEILLARLSLGRTDRTLAVSETLAAAVREDIPGANVGVLRSAAPTPAPSAEAEEAQPFVLAVANDYFHKDWEGLAAMFELRPELPRLVLVGAARSPERLARLRSAYPRTTFTGPVRDRPRLGSLYAAAICTVAHSFLESTSLTPLEALLHGSPVAVTDIPAHREHLGDATSYYVPTDAASLAAAVEAARMPDRLPPAAVRRWDDVAGELVDHLTRAARA